MQLLEDLVSAGRYAQVREALGGLNEKERRQAAKWVQTCWKARRDQLDDTGEAQANACWKARQEGRERPATPALDSWLCLCVASALLGCAKDGVAIPLPQRLHGWRSHYPLEPEGLLAVLDAMVSRGTVWVTEYLELACSPKRVERLNIRIAIALIEGFALPWPQEAQFYAFWGEEWRCYLPSRLRQQVYGIRVPVLRVDVPAGTASVQVVQAESFQQAVAALPAPDVLLRELLARRDSILSLQDAYSGTGDAELLAQAIGQLVADGQIARAPLLESLLMALTRGDAVSALRLQARLLEMVADDEGILRQRAALASVFAGAHGSAAGVAQQLLQRSDLAQALEPAMFAELCEMAFARKEKGLRETQLAWIGNRIGTQPAQSAATLQGLFAALGVEDLAFQKKAVALIQKHWGRADAATRAALTARLEAVRGVLDAALASTLAAATGAPEDVADAPVAALHVAPMQELRPVTRFTVPPADAATLRELQAALAARPTVCAFEQILCMALALAATDRRALRLGLQSISSDFPVECLGALQKAAFDRYDARQPPARHSWDHSDFGSIVLLARTRYHEIAAAIMRNEPYPLLSRPDYSHGAIDAASLVQRLQQLAAQAMEAPPADFLVALLRTRQPSPDELAAMRAIGSAQARVAADFLAAGGAAQMRTAWHRVQAEAGSPRNWNAPTRWIVPEHAEICVSLSAMPHPPALADAGAFLPKGFTPETATDVWQFDHAEGLLTSVLPEQGEALAAMALWAFRKAGHDEDTEGGKAAAMALPAYLAARGPAGPALHLAVLFTLSASDAGARLAGSDGLIELIAQERYDSALAGELVAACIGCGSVKVARLAKSLVPAVDAGAGKVLWPLLVAAVGAALAQATPPAGSPDLLALAHRVALGLGIREPIAGLAETAARKGSSKLLVEARRLNEWLGG